MTSANIVDFTVVSALQTHVGLLQFRQWYDISCTYNINQQKRWDAIKRILDKFSTIKSVDFEQILSCVGDFHLTAHKEACHAYQNGAFREGSAKTDGEAGERVWAENTQVSARTKEMNPGHRKDELTNHLADQNRRKVNAMRTFLPPSCQGDDSALTCGTSSGNPARKMAGGVPALRGRSRVSRGG